jgi:hypothetical protein
LCWLWLTSGYVRRNGHFCGCGWFLDHGGEVVLCLEFKVFPFPQLVHVLLSLEVGWLDAVH